MTNRQTFHDGEARRRFPTVSRFGKYNGYDSCRIPVGCYPAAEGAVMPDRISRKRLEEISPGLSERDNEFLN
jgi:hypothetical protein